MDPQTANTREESAGVHDEPPAPASIESIGRFRVRGKLGEGGMGVVYAAYDGELDREVAIKVLRTVGSDSDHARARLLREARAMARLSHPNVITIFDVVAESDRVFIAMELVRGASLRRWVAVRPRTWRSILEVYVDAGRGLAAAHRAGIIHRDFKPDNVLVGDDGRVRVLDFGLARAAGPSSPAVPAALGLPLGPPLGSGENVDRITITGAVLGTPAYMAPEQWRGGTVDARTDQFSFCVALWEALFGARPFVGDVPTVLATKVMAGEIRPISEQGDVPTWLVRVLRRGLAPEPNDRHPTMDALLDVIARLRRSPMDDSVTPEPETRGRFGPLFARRYELIGGPRGPAAVARDPLSDRTVAIRRIEALDAPDHEDRVDRVRKLAAIRHPNVVAVLDHGTTADGDYLVVERHERAVDPIEFGRDQPRPIQLSLIAQLLRAIACLHERGLVHGHLGPQTIAVVDGHLRISDLVPALVDRPRGDLDPAYAAPEILLGEARTVAADLWSAGVLAHELLLGRRPHVASTAGAAVEAVLSQPPEAAALHGLEAELAAVVRRLLEPDRQKRFASANEALRALVATTRGALSLETVETRESALRGAAFAGRRKELAQLVTGLRRSIDGAGELWLVGGESGLGKSRLLDELRSEAIARGAVVVRGQARADGGRPYEVWREVFRMLALACDDDEASVLAPQVPDLARLRGHRSRPAPDLDAKSTQQRLARIVASCIGRVESPLVLLLDDLQWAGSESLDLLGRLAMRLAAMRVLVVGTFRDDEAPALASELPTAKTLGLEPLGAEALTELTAAMTGTSARSLDALLQRETEGNALLFIEVMRFLAEEAGDLHSVATMALPETVSAGGVRRAMRRRLDRLAPSTRPVLEVAAIAGRDLDLEVLTRIVAKDLLDAALSDGVAAAVLEVDADRWRFRHDKLREQLLADLSEDRRRALHGEVADALCAQAGASDLHVQAIARHFHEAGRLADEARFCGPAGEQALANGAYADAARLLSRAAALQSHVAADRVDRIRWQRKLGEAHYVLGALSAAVDGLGGALRELGRPLPGSRLGWTWLLVRLLVVQVVLLLFAGRFVAKQQRRRAELAEAANAAGRLANLSTYSGDVLRVLTLSILSANLAERAGRPSAYSLAVMGYSASFMGLRRLADRYFARASASAVAQDDPIALVEATQMECAYRLGAGEFARVRRLLDEGYAAAERADYQLGLALAEGFIGQCDYFLGNFQGMLAHYSRARELLTMRSPEHDHSFRVGEAQAYCMLGRFDDAERTLAAVAAGSGASYLLGEAFVLAVRAHIAAWRPGGDPRAAADATIAYVQRHAIAVPPPCMQVLTGPAESLVASARTKPDTVAELRRHVARLRKWAKRNPVGEAPASLFAGILAELEGNRSDAIAACERASTSATRLGLRFVQAQAELELGTLRGSDTVPGRGHLERARDLARRCDAAWHRGRADALLAESMSVGDA